MHILTFSMRYNSIILRIKDRHNFDLKCIMLEINSRPLLRVFSPGSSGKLIYVENNCLPPTPPAHLLIQIGRTQKQLLPCFIVWRTAGSKIYAINTIYGTKFTDDVALLFNVGSSRSWQWVCFRSQFPRCINPFDGKFHHENRKCETWWYLKHRPCVYFDNLRTRFENEGMRNWSETCDWHLRMKSENARSSRQVGWEKPKRRKWESSAEKKGDRERLKDEAVGDAGLGNFWGRDITK